MFLADYHMHTYPYSPDANNSIYEMADAALKMGLTHICITNHAENCSQSPNAPGQFPPFEEWDKLKAEFDAVRDAFEGRLDMRLGAEVGGPHFAPDIGRKIYARPELDFIIGSIHNLRDADDFYYLTYPEDFNEFRPTVETYLSEYVEMAGSGLCDVLGHIGYMQKYMADQGKGFNMMDFEGLLRDIFNTCVRRGVGIEVNCSSLHEKHGQFVPQPDVVKLYRECGGEIITCGSDSHSTVYAGSGIREAYALLRELGFKYVCLFKNHEPEFVRL